MTYTCFAVKLLYGVSGKCVIIYIHDPYIFLGKAYWCQCRVSRECCTSAQGQAWPAALVSAVTTSWRWGSVAGRPLQPDDKCLYVHGTSCLFVFCRARLPTPNTCIHVPENTPYFPVKVTTNSPTKKFTKTYRNFAKPEEHQRKKKKETQNRKKWNRQLGLMVSVFVGGRRGKEVQHVVPHIM